MTIFAEVEQHHELRQHVAPDLRTWPSVNVWIAGCLAPERAWATAIVLREEGLYQRAMIYVTDADEARLERARRGVFAAVTGPGAAAAIAADEAAYRAAGGRATLDEYVTRAPGTVTLRPLLRERMAFFQHDPSEGGSPNEFHVILSDGAGEGGPPEHAARVLSLFHASLARFGVLGLAGEAAFGLHPRRGSYEPVGSGRLHRRVR